MHPPTRILGLTLVGTLLVAALRVDGAVIGDVELLRQVAIQHKANTESIVTWQGQVNVSYVGRRGDNYLREMDVGASFALSRVQDAVRWNRQSKRSLFQINGEERQDPENGYSAGMLKNGRFYHYAVPEEAKGQEWQFLRVMEPADYANQMNSLEFDPRDHLKDHGEAVYDRLMFLYENVSRLDEADWRLSRQGTLVTVESRFDGGKSVNRYVFDMAKGGNLISYYAKVSGEEKRDYEYEEKGGIWVLKSIRLSHTYKQDGIDVSDASEIEFTKNAVNEPLAPDEFSLARMGVKPGDWVIDTRSKVNFKYMEDVSGNPDLPEELDVPALPDDQVQSVHLSADGLPAPETAQGVSASPSAGDGAFYRYAIAAIVGLVVLGFVIARRARRSPKEGRPQ